MKIIIFAGGTGKRFWPVSRKKSPKQFLPIIDDTPLLRLRYNILVKEFKNEDIFISTGIQYKSEVLNILPELPERNFIFEPEMRDTGPAVSLAVTYVDSLFPGEVLSIQWSDHLIKHPDVFTNALKEAERLVKEEKKIVLISVPARFPSPHRGYIHFGEKVRDISKGLSHYKFLQFVEKPTKEIAEKYLEDGFYGWNPGYWNMTAEQYNSKLKVSRPDFFETISEIKKENFSTASLEAFRGLEKISADYVFAEHLRPEETVVLQTDMGWSDVGEWIAFKEALEESPDANVVFGKNSDLDSHDTLIYNSEDSKLIATIGLRGMVIVNTKDVLAVFSKDDNNRMKEFLKELEASGITEYL